jgi:mRNA interferase MazF
MNNFLNTVFIIPLTSTKISYPTRVDCTFQNKEGQVAIDQMRAVDKVRLVKKLGIFKDKFFMEQVMDVLQEIFTL